MIYNLIRFIFMILLSPYLLFKKEFIQKRMTSYKKVENSNYIWFNMASVGEVNLSYSLISKLSNQSDEKILITVMTDTGMETAQKKYKNNEKITITYFPLDSRNIIRKILNKINIKLLVLIETEIWPNLINEVSKKSKIILLNGRISDKSYSSYLKLKWLLKKILNKIDVLYMQSDEDVKRIINLGALKNRTEKKSNLKFSIELKKETEEKLNQIKQKYKINDKKVFVAGSTHLGEEEFILKSMKNISDYFVFLVPRHIERCDEIEKQLLKFKFNYARWTDQNIDDNVNVILVDKIGVLTTLYQISDISFVGGSIVNIGGHNLLEPLYYKKPPIFGEHMQNAQEIADEIKKRKIGIEIKNNVELENAIKSIENKEIAIDRIDNFFKENQKSLKDSLQIIQKSI